MWLHMTQPWMLLVWLVQLLLIWLVQLLEPRCCFGLLLIWLAYLWGMWCLIRASLVVWLVHDIVSLTCRICGVGFDIVGILSTAVRNMASGGRAS